jgi:phosphatidylinositol alpha-1,6-mannosyltransferase
LSDDSLANAYIAADVLIFPVLDITGDMEGFGMVAIEAAAHGTPTVAFSVGGVPDAIAEGVSGNLIQPGNYSEFAETVAKHLGGEIGGIDPASCRTHAEQYSWPRFGERLRGVFSHALKIQGAR